jgi:integrase
LGKREFVKSLKTTDIKLARRLSIDMADKLEELFIKIRSGLKLLSPHDMSLISKSMSQSETESLMVEALEDFKNRTREEEEWEAFHARDFRLQVLDNLKDSRFEMAFPRVDKFLLSKDLSIEPNTAIYVQMCRAALTGLANTFENAELIVRGDFENPKLHIEVQNTPDIRSISVHQEEAVLCFEQVIDQYLKDHSSSWSEKQYLSQQAKLNYFLNYIQNQDGITAAERTLDSVTNAQVRQYKEHLQESPKNAKQKYPNLSPQECVAAALRDGAKTLSQTSQNNYLQCLSTLFSFAVRELDYEGKNPFKGRSVSTASKAQQRDQRNPFSREQLKRLFSSPLYQGCKSLSSCHREGDLIADTSHKYWTPLIGLFTGMRLQEILQLYAEDVYEKDGIWIFDLNTNHTDKRLKTPQSKRLVPIHKDLIKLGFIDFWKMKQATKESKRLFEDALLANDGTYSSTFSKWFSRYLKNIEIKTGKTSFHSLRHNMKDFFRQVGESDELTENFMGRSTGSTGEAYGSGFSVERFNKALHKINFEEVIPD